MEEQTVQVTYTKAQVDSIRYGICYILSNGNELKTAVTDNFKEDLKKKGYWVAAIYVDGFRADL